MELKELIGEEIELKDGQNGTITAIESEEYVVVSMHDLSKKRFSEDSFRKGYLRFLDSTKQEIIENEKKELEQKEFAREMENLQAQRELVERKKEDYYLTKTIEALGKVSKLKLNSLLTNHKIQSYKYYGTSAKRIYCEAVKEFGFNKNLVNHIGSKKHLFALNVTKDKKSIYFIKDFSMFESDEGRLMARLNQDINTIKIYYKELKCTLLEDKNDLFVFAKNRGAYAFLGIYAFEKINSDLGYKQYKLILKTYPQK